MDSVEDLRRLERFEEVLEDKLDAEAADRVLADPKAEFADWQPRPNRRLAGATATVTRRVWCT